MLEEPRAKPRAARRPNYLLVLIILVAFTALEIGASYLTGGIKLPILLLLAGVKAGLVILYFMHLRFDSRWFALWFILGAILVFPLLLYLGALMPGR
jgi:caa(3)-type oxidase subunit IV